MLAQIASTCVVTLVFWTQGESFAISALIGGLICLIPNLYSARKLTAKRTADLAELTRTIFSAELGKIVITATLFTLVFATQEWIQPVALLSGFILAQLTHWIMPLWADAKNKHKKGIRT